MQALQLVQLPHPHQATTWRQCSPHAACCWSQVRTPGFIVGYSWGFSWGATCLGSAWLAMHWMACGIASCLATKKTFCSTQSHVCLWI